MSASTVALSLIAHTNVGKTTLARTLLRRDIGEVRDEAHVTQAAERHLLVESSAGDRLELWDTPGFGDSVRLAKRLQQAGNPIGWFLGEVWDRLADRAYWSAQRALRNVVEQADVVLYLVNASESPVDVDYLDAELQVLELIGKPVIVLLNQLGRPLDSEQSAREIERWRARTATRALNVLPLDAFARCWVQEAALWQAVNQALPVQQRDVMARLQRAWRARSDETLTRSIRGLAKSLLESALDVEVAAGDGWSAGLHRAGAALGWGGAGQPGGRENAMRQLADRMEARTLTCTEALIGLHGLSGQATRAVRQRVAEQYRARRPLDEGRSAVMGGLATGALAGLKADVATGGLTLGGGLLAGGLIGALAGAGLARGFNRVRGLSEPTLSWSGEAMTASLRDTLLTYLAVAHYGRGRGDWQASEHPAFWADEVDAVLREHGEGVDALWERRDDARDDASAQRELHDDLNALLLDLVQALLQRLYPGADVALGALHDSAAT